MDYNIGDQNYNIYIYIIVLVSNIIQWSPIIYYNDFFHEPNYSG